MMSEPQSVTSSLRVTSAACCLTKLPEESQRAVALKCVFPLDAPVHYFGPEIPSYQSQQKCLDP